MVNGTNRAPQFGIENVEGPVVAKTLNELPMQQRQKITSELKRIHKIVSALDENTLRSSADNKADRA